MHTYFPDPASADAEGVVHVSDTMTPEMVIAAYSAGIFPWSTAPVRWYSPDPRAVFDLRDIHLSHSLQREARSDRFSVTFDTAFVDVMRACAEAHASTRVWISDLFVKTYDELHARGHAHSIEVWQNGELVGGIYGVLVGSMFAGESMFHRVDNASKLAFAFLARHLADNGIELFDTQVANSHTRSLGALEIPRAVFLRRLASAIAKPCPALATRWPSTPESWTHFPASRPQNSASRDQAAELS